ncbi:MAG: hypothetical protein IJH11_08360, partial [Lachnospiraceae bacterium]|nr:hypothetical protein [Lachnospiraceae bacterium]
IADDFKQIWHKLHNGKAHRAAQKGSKEPVSDISDRGESDYLSIKFAEKGAFQAFYEQWLKDHVSSSKEEKDIRQIHGLNVDMKTGEVVNKPKASVEVKKPIHTHFAAQAAGQSAASGKKHTNAAQEEKSNPRYTTVLDEQEVVVSSAKGTRQKKPKENAPEEPATEKKEQKTQNNSGAGREPVKDPEVEEFAPITTAQANPLGTGEPSAVKKKKTMPYVKK